MQGFMGNNLGSKELLAMIKEINEESGLTEQYDVDTHDWEMTNAKEAKGKGKWNFVIHDADDKGVDEFSHEGEFEDARKGLNLAIKKARGTRASLV